MALLLPGCGSSESSDRRPSKAVFLKRANAICAKGTNKIDAAGTSAFKSPGNPTQAETTAFAKSVVVPTVQRELDQLRALSPPKGDEARVKEILDKSQAAVAKVRANPALLGGENGSDEANRLATAYGLAACAT